MNRRTLLGFLAGLPFVRSLVKAGTGVVEDAQSQGPLGRPLAEPAPEKPALEWPRWLIPKRCHCCGHALRATRTTMTHDFDYRVEGAACERCGTEWSIFDDKTLETCRLKFDNSELFKGEPRVPS